MRAVEQMVLFFMASFSDETSGHMRNVVRYAIHALSRMDSPTIFTCPSSEHLAQMAA
jgi:hypothetical protein